MYLYVRMMEPGQMYPGVLNMNLANRSRFLEFVLVYLDTAPWIILEDSVLLSVLLALLSGLVVLQMEPGIHIQPVLEIQEKHKMAATHALDQMADQEIEQQKQLEVVAPEMEVVIMEALELAIRIMEAIVERLEEALEIEKVMELAIEIVIKEANQEETATEIKMEERETMGIVVLNPSATTVHHHQLATTNNKHVATNSNHEATQASALTRTAMEVMVGVRVVEAGVLGRF